MSLENFGRAARLIGAAMVVMVLLIMINHRVASAGSANGAFGSAVRRLEAARPQVRPTASVLAIPSIRVIPRSAASVVKGKPITLDSRRRLKPAYTTQYFDNTCGGGCFGENAVLFDGVYPGDVVSFSVGAYGPPDTCGYTLVWTPQPDDVADNGFLQSLLPANTDVSSAGAIGYWSYIAMPGFSATGGAVFDAGRTQDGPLCLTLGGAALYNYLIVNVVPAQRPIYMDKPRPCKICRTSRNLPVDVTTGSLWEDRTDVSMPGPFGLKFTRHYGLNYPSSGDMGGHWTHNFADRIIPKTLPSEGLLTKTTTSATMVMYLDQEHMPHYFGGSFQPGQTMYENVSGLTLAIDESGVASVTSFDGEKRTFDAEGNLIRITDRIGNTQIVSRDAKTELMQSVTDSLGRSLCFFYDSQGRINGVMSNNARGACPGAFSPSALSVGYSYDTGTDPQGNVNCVTGQLCSVTDQRNKVWKYGYADAYDSLNAAFDPLGNVLEANTFADDGGFGGLLGSAGPILSQHTGRAGSRGGNVVFNYIEANPNDATGVVGHTRVVNPDTGETSDFFFNQNLQITQESGFECDCNGYQSRIFTYDQFDRVTTETDNGNNAAGGTHVVTFTYGRDGAGQAYPGPTSISETLDASTTRTMNLSYYPVGDARQDLVRILQIPSVSMPGAYKTETSTYNAQGLLTADSITGFVGNQIQTRTILNTFDQRGRLISLTRPRQDVAETSTLSYYSDTDGDGARAGQLAAVTDALGHTTTVGALVGSSYDAFGHPESVTDPNGVQIISSYDASGNVISKQTNGVVDGGNRTLRTAFNYDAADRLTSLVKPSGNTESFFYDSASRPVSKILSDGAGNEYDQLSSEYNSSDEILSIGAQACQLPMPNCASWATTTYNSFQYDTFGEMVESDEAAVGGKTAKASQTYTNQGLVASSTDENHQSANATYEYDLAGRLKMTTHLSLVLGLTQVTNSEAYDTSNDVVSLIDENGSNTAYTYDDFGELLSESSAAAGVNSYSYDADGNRTRILRSNGTSTSYGYDPLDRQVSAASSTQGGLTETVTRTYDNPAPGQFGIGRLWRVSDPSGSQVFAYDFRGNVSSVSRKVDSASFLEMYGYDVDGNLDLMMYPDGTTIAYQSDYADRPYSAVQVRAGSQATPVSGSLLSGTGGLSAAAPRNVGITRRERQINAAPGTSNKVRQFAMPMVNGHELVVTDAERHSLEQSVTRKHYTWSALTLSGRQRARNAWLAAGSLPSGTVVVASTAYAPFGPLVGRVYGNGSVESRSLDARYRPAHSTLTSPIGVLLSDVSYGLDSVGNVTLMSDNLDQRYSSSYYYDDLNRILLSVSGPQAASGAPPANNVLNQIENDPNKPLWGVASYQYDGIGDVTTSLLGTRALSFSYNSTSAQLAKVQGTGSNVGAVAYDASGNEVSIGSNRYSYSPRNELVQAQGPEYGDHTTTNVTGDAPPVLPGSTGTLGAYPKVSTGQPWTYEYDASGARVATTANIPTLPTTASLSSASVSEKRVSVPDVWGHLAAESATDGSGRTQYDYVWMGDIPVAQLDAVGFGVHFTYTNHLGAPVVQTDVNANVSYQADYEPSGAIYDVRRMQNPHQPLRLPGQVAEQFDTGQNGATDLSYNGARWYRPAWGRYSQSDPFGLGAGSNRFAYAGDSPINNIDPTGLCVVVARYHWIEDGNGLLNFASHGLLELRPDPDLVVPGVRYVSEAEPDFKTDTYSRVFGYDYADVISDSGKGSAEFANRIGAVNRTPLERQGNQVISNQHGRPCGCVAKDLEKLAKAFNAKHYIYAPVPDQGAEFDANSNTFFFEEVAFEEGVSNPTLPEPAPWGFPVFVPGYYHASGFNAPR